MTWALKNEGGFNRQNAGKEQSWHRHPGRLGQYLFREANSIWMEFKGVW